MITTREHDFPVFELELQQNLLRTNQGAQANTMFQFILNAALDPVETIQWQQNSMYLKCVDKFRDSSTKEDSFLLVHCFITPGNSKFLLLHENKPED